jgi:osmotically-inducible protein OsmY
VLAGRFFVPLVPFCRRTDGELLSSANDALQQLTQVPADYVDIRVIQGWINLRGTVDWDWQREAVVSAMRRLVGVAGVGDGIEIRPASA